MQLFLKFVLTFLSIVSVSAFPSGAGDCFGGGPAVGAAHMMTTIRTPDFDDAGFSVMFDDNTDTITVSGPDYKGVLIRVQGLDDTGIPIDNGIALIPDESTQMADACETQPPSVEGVTHTSRAIKTSVTSEVMLLNTVVVELDIQVTIVIQNSDDLSMHTYKAITAMISSTMDMQMPSTMPSASPSMTPVAPPVMEPMTPTDNGDKFGISDFFRAIGRFFVDLFRGIFG